MSEPILETPPMPTPPTTPPKPPETPEPAKVPEQKDWEAEATKWKAFARKHEDAAKANADKASQYDAFEEANKSELQKAADRATAAEAKVAEMQARALRAEVAAAKGIPAALLSGTTQDELEASADALLEFRGEKPKPDFGGGERGGNIAPAAMLSAADIKQLYAEKQYDAIEQARQDGRIAMGPPK